MNMPNCMMFQLIKNALTWNADIAMESERQSFTQLFRKYAVKKTMGFYGKSDGTIEHFQIKEVRWGVGPKKHKLLNCPKCGSDRVDLWYVGSGNFGGWRAICSSCGFLPDRLCKIEQDAADLWNGVIT